MASRCLCSRCWRRVRTRVQVWRDGGGLRTGAVSFRSVPSFAFAREIMIDSREWGPLQLDIAYGGAFYAILPADSIGLDLRDTPARHFAEADRKSTRLNSSH